MWILLDKVCADVLSNEDVEEETKAALREMKLILERKKKMESTSTQVGAREIIEDEQCHELMALIDAATSEEDVESLLSRQWPRGAFRRTSWIKENAIAETIKAKPLVLIADPISLREQPLKEYGELAEVIRSVDEAALKAKEGVLIERKESIKVEGRQLGQSSCLLIFAANKGADQSEILKVCRNITDRLKLQKIMDFAISAPGTDTSIVRKAMEVTLKKEEDMHCAILGAVPKKHTEQRRQIDIELGDRSFTDVVKSLKGMEAQFGGVRVDRVQQRENTIRLAVRAQEGKSRELATEITAATELKATVHEVQNKGIFIHGLDREATAEEVKEKLAKAAGCTAASFKMGDIRDRLNGRFALVYTAARNADALTRLGEIRSGWSTWTIREKIDPDFCVKCQAFGHETKTCTKEMTKGLKCMKCGELGHLHRECKNETACGTCLVKGHQMNSMACSNYRYLVQMKRATRSFL